MKLHNSLKFLSLLIATTIILSACTTNNANNSEELTTPDVNIEQPATDEMELDKDEPNLEEESQEDTTEQPVDATQLPSSKQLELLIEGMPEKVDAALTLSDLGYAFYLMDIFEFTMEEPGRDVIYSKALPDYFARVELLPADTNAVELKESVMGQLNELGQATELNEDEFKSYIQSDVNFFVRSSNDEITRETILLDAENGFFLVSLFLPHGEAIEGLTPRLYAMIQTLTATK